MSLQDGFGIIIYGKRFIIHLFFFLNASTLEKLGSRCLPEGGEGSNHQWRLKPILLDQRPSSLQFRSHPELTLLGL